MTVAVMPAQQQSGQQKQAQMVAFLYAALASVALFPHYVLGAYIGGPALAYIVFLTAGALLLSAEFSLTLLVLCLFLQNMFLALVSPLSIDLDHFTPMLATSFINIAITSVFGALTWYRLRRSMPAESTALMRSLVIFFAVISAYTLLGIVKASLNDALVYMRVYVVGGLLLAIGIAFGYRLPYTFSVNVLRVLSAVLVTWGLLEFFFPYELYSLFHIDDYIRLKYDSSPTMTIANVQDVINFASRSYLNLSGAMGLEVKVLRPQGPNIHPISYAYALAFGALVCYVNRYTLLSVLCIALLILVGAKGPCILAIVSILLAVVYGISRNARAVLAILAVFMGLYVVTGIAYGLSTEDYHVIGLMGGIKGFLSNPLGRGVGVGGNLSTMALIYTNFSLFQGYGADFALESGFGVMIYQIGIGAAAFFLFYWRLWKNIWKACMHFSDEPRLVAIPCALALLLVNSVFQEEAFSPAGWGPLMLLSGLLLAKYWQEPGIRPKER